MATPNSLFAIIAAESPTAVETRVGTLAPWVSWKLAEGQWLLIAPSGTTTKEVSDAVGFTMEADSIGNGIVVRVESYFGRYSRSVWEWIATKQGADLVTQATQA